MARNHKLTVCIGTPEAPFVPRWTFWTQKNDTYLTTYAMGGLYKVSLHASGVWAGAFTTESGVLANGTDAPTAGSARPNSSRALSAARKSASHDLIAATTCHSKPVLLRKTL
jgi:hypothetical protein